MQHPFASLEGEYNSLLTRMQVTRQSEVDFVARKLMKFVAANQYKEVSNKLGIPQIFIATSFERESSSDFRCSPAQGDRWDRVSVNVPRGRGPFPNWTAAAIDAYTLDHLDQVGAANWTWARFCYEGELFNGFGYRSQGIHTPYLWAGTNNYTSGKFVSDGQFDPNHVDTQLGTVAVARAMVQMDATLDLPGSPPPPDIRTPTPTPQPAPIGIGAGTAWVQDALNKLKIADPPLVVDGNSDRLTRAAVAAFQQKAGITVDGLVGPETIGAIEKALAGA
jgi:lysozyme family protein